MNLWRTRLTWAALGAGATAILMWPMTRGEQAAPTRGRASPQRPAVAAPGSLAPGPGPSASPSAGGEPSTPAVGEHPAAGTTSAAPQGKLAGAPATGSVETGSAETGSVGSGESTGEQAAGSVESDASTSLQAASTTGGASDSPSPEIPLPRMPGARRMHRSARRGDDGGWIVSQALSVPAPGAQVEAYYRKALAEAGLRVSGGEVSASEGWRYRATLRGRSRRVRAELTVRQREGRMMTVARIYWRTPSG